MTDFFIVKKSQLSLFKTIPFYYQTQNGQYSLYKKEGDRLDEARLKTVKYPDLFIIDTDREKAIIEFNIALKKDFETKIAEGRLQEVRQTLEFIVQEALTPGLEKNITALPETLDILMGRYNKDHTAMEYLRKMASNSSILVEHTVNVMALTLQFCFFHKFPESDTQQLAMAALLHDVGCAQINKDLIESNKRLTDQQFRDYTDHPNIGYSIITENTDFDVAISTVAREHHERLDGNGYPNGLTRIASYSQLIGLIDCYESLTYRGKSFRKPKKPFEALKVIKEEVLRGKFAKDLFKKFTACLVR
jgi:HD-GYP domain-containing protein (c-di-GMP phosphodiesterase class II)